VLWWTDLFTLYSSNFQTLLRHRHGARRRVKQTRYSTFTPTCGRAPRAHQHTLRVWMTPRPQIRGDFRNHSMNAARAIAAIASQRVRLGRGRRAAEPTHSALGRQRRRVGNPPPPGGVRRGRWPRRPPRSWACPARPPRSRPPLPS